MHKNPLYNAIETAYFEVCRLTTQKNGDNQRNVNLNPLFFLTEIVTKEARRQRFPTLTCTHSERLHRLVELLDEETHRQRMLVKKCNEYVADDTSEPEDDTRCRIAAERDEHHDTARTLHQIAMAAKALAAELAPQKK